MHSFRRIGQSVSRAGHASSRTQISPVMRGRSPPGALSLRHTERRVGARLSEESSRCRRPGRPAVGSTCTAWPEYFSLSHKRHERPLDPHIWSNWPKVMLDLVVLEPWPGFVRQADLCRAVLRGECALLPPSEHIQHGSGRVCGNLCAYEAGESSVCRVTAVGRLAETAVDGTACRRHVSKSSGTPLAH
jgi:hypothetical protein